jgi:hypothetical protein
MGFNRPLGSRRLRLPPFMDCWHMKVARLSAQCTGSLYSKETSMVPACTGSLYSKETSMVLISVGGWANPRDTVQPEGLSHWRIPLTPSWIKPPTFRLVMQCLNQLRHCIPHPPKRLVLHYPPWEDQILQLTDFSSSLISFFTDHRQAGEWLCWAMHMCTLNMYTKWTQNDIVFEGVVMGIWTLPSTQVQFHSL